MIQDASEIFDPVGTALTVTRVSTNVLDLGANRDLGTGLYRSKPIVWASSTFTASAQTATLNVQLQGAPDNGAGLPGGYTTLAESSPVPIGMLVAGNRIAQFDLPSIANQITLANAAGCTATFSSASATMTVSVATGIQAGMYVSGAGIVPGTTVASSYTLGSTTVPLSANTTAAATATLIAFSTQVPAPRFLQMNYVVANGPFTAGALGASFFAAPVDALIHYRSGFVAAS